MARQLLTSSLRRSREPSEDEVPRSRRPEPGKLSTADAVSANLWRYASPGKLTVADAGLDGMSPAHALRYARWAATRQVDRRAESGGADVEDGALATAFAFLDGHRGGAPLPDALRKRLGAQLGVDLSAVRIHTDGRAAAAAAALDARAFTIGDDIYFAAGAYDPRSKRGIELIAHEVAHVAQQRRQPSRKGGVSRPGDAHEQQADAFAAGVSEPGAADPASVVERLRREGQRTRLPFREELEEQLGAQFGFVEAYVGAAAQVACDALAASAFAIHDIVAIASPSPTRELMLHELTHVVQMGNRRAPAQFARGSLGVSDPGSPAEREASRGVSATQTAPAGQIHRDTKKDDKSGEPGANEKRFKWFADNFRKLISYPTRDPAKAGTPHEAEDFFRFEAAGHKYRRASEEPFAREQYFGAFRAGTVPTEFAGLKENTLRNDIPTVLNDPTLAKKYRVSRVGDSEGRRYVFTEDGDWAAVVTDNASPERKAANPVDQFNAYFGAYQKLKTRIGNRFPLGTTVTPTTCTYTAEAAEEYRTKLKTAIAAAYVALGDNAWDVFYVEVMKGRAFPALQNRIQGDIFEQIVHDSVGVPLAGTEPLFRKPGVLKKNPRKGDDAKFFPGGSIVIDAKAVEGLVDKEQAEDYAKITDPRNGIRGYFGGQKESDAVAYKAVAYAIPGGNEPADPNNPKGPTRADRIQRQLEKIFVKEDKSPDTSRFHVSPDPKGLRTWLLSFNPTLELRAKTHERTHYEFDAPAITHPGVSIKRAKLNLDGPDGEIKSGDVTVVLDMGGALKTDPVKKKIEADATGGRVKNEFTEFKTKLDDLLGPVTITGGLSNEGIEAAIAFKPGSQKIPGFDVKSVDLKASYTGEGALTMSGGVTLAHKSGKLSGTIAVGWTGGAWSFDGSATLAAGLVDGLEECTVGVRYEAGKTKIYATEARYQRTIGGVTLGGSVYDLEYDVDHGWFSGSAAIDANLGPFGNATAIGTLKKNRLDSASFSYDSPEIRFPKGDSPVFSGKVGGTIDYEGGKLSGHVRGNCDLALPGLSHFAQGGKLGLAADARIDHHGKFSGTIKNTDPLMFGDYFKIPHLEAKIDPEGAPSAKFEIELAGIKSIKKTSLTGQIDAGGFEIIAGQVSLQFGDPEHGRVWGDVMANYDVNEGLLLTGNASARLGEKTILTGGIKYSTKTGKADVKVKTEQPIPILNTHTDKTIFEYAKNFPLIGFPPIISLDLATSFDLGFHFGLDVGVTPSAEVKDLDLRHMTFSSITAEMDVDANLNASLTATPGIGLGFTVISDMFLAGSAGIKIPITAGASLMSKLRVPVTYQSDGTLSAEASLGMSLDFGIDGAIVPYAKLSVLDGMYNPDWTGEPLTQFTIMPKRRLLDFNLDFGGELSKKEPELPSRPPLATEGSKAKTEMPKSLPAPPKESVEAKSVGEKNSGGGIVDIDQMKSKFESWGPYESLHGILMDAKAVWEKFEGAIDAIKDGAKFVGGKIVDAGEWAYDTVSDGVGLVGDGLSAVGGGFEDAVGYFL